MSVLEKLQKDLTAAMKAGDRDRTSTIRLMVNCLKNERIALAKDLSEDQENAILSKEAKKRRESIDMYRQGDRTDLADQEERELHIIESYLPEALSNDELCDIIEKVIEETGAASLNDMGKVMGAVMPRVRGRADGKQIQGIVREKLG